MKLLTLLAVLSTTSCSFAIAAPLTADDNPPATLPVEEPPMIPEEPCSEKEMQAVASLLAQPAGYYTTDHLLKFTLKLCHMEPPHVAIPADLDRFINKASTDLSKFPVICYQRPDWQDIVPLNKIPAMPKNQDRKKMSKENLATVEGDLRKAARLLLANNARVYWARPTKRFVVDLLHDVDRPKGVEEEWKVAEGNLRAWAVANQDVVKRKYPDLAYMLPAAPKPKTMQAATN